MVKPAIQGPRYLAPGNKLGKYELIRQIAVGGMAELYLGRTVGIEGFEKLVVLKRILPQYASSASFVNMFLSEARLAATLHHPNIAQVYDIGGESGDYFFSMEYIHGEDLNRLIATAMENGVGLSLDTALTLVCGVCAGLHYAHEKVGTDGHALNVVHRDVSPSNVLVSYDGAVKVVDFGIARVSTSHPDAEAREKSTGGLKGKIAYMSPEQCRGKASLDRRSDLFSVGSILFEMTTGVQPFTDETEYGVLNQIVNTDARRPSSIVPSYPPALERIVMKALARDPDARYSTGLEMQTDLEDFAHENRLRMSALVLARLMSSLFPARLEEWQHAKAQGAFFVEQHVVRTLIESGKTSDSALRYEPPVDEADAPDTSVGPPPEELEDQATQVKAVPTPPPLALPPPPQRPTPAKFRVMTPQPGSVPIMQIAQPGTLVTSQVMDVVTPIVDMHVDRTERVQALPSPIVPMPADPTTIVPIRRRSRLPAIILGSAAGLAVVIVGYVATRSDATVVPAPVVEAAPPVVEIAKPPPPPPPPEPVAAKVAEPEPAKVVEPEPAKVAEPEPAKVVEPEPAKVVDAPAPEIEMPAAKPSPKKPVAKKTPPVAKPTVKKPAKKSEEKPWNDDSPFMPVRTDKH